MPKRKTLLDVGCGEGRDCIAFAKKGYAVMGIEKNPSVFEKAKNNVNSSVGRKYIELYNKDIREMQLNKKFDKILCNFVLMFMPKKDFMEMLERLYAKLNDGGELLIKVLMADDPVAIRLRQKDEVFFPSYNDMRELEYRYGGTLKFKLQRDKPHGNLDFPHIHSVGILKILHKY